jgi:hypothetical protein
MGLVRLREKGKSRHGKRGKPAVKLICQQESVVIR